MKTVSTVNYPEEFFRKGEQRNRMMALGRGSRLEEMVFLFKMRITIAYLHDNEEDRSDIVKLLKYGTCNFILNSIYFGGQGS